MGLTVAEARLELDSIKSTFLLVQDTPAILAEWERLIVAHDCKAKSAHDARLVAAMHVHGIPELLTFNGQDFARYSGVVVLEPVGVAVPPKPAGPT